MPGYARYRAISGQGLPCVAMLTLCQKQAGVAPGACERPGRNPVPGRPCWAPLAPRHAWEALACPHARPSSPAGYTPALIAHVGTPWAQSHLPWPFETSECWGVLSQVARVGHAVPPLTSMLTPGRGLLPGPHAPVLPPLVSSAQIQLLWGWGGRATPARLVNRALVFTWFPAAFQGSVLFLT